MRKLTMVFSSAVALWLAIPTALAQNTVDVLGGGPQPANTFGCAPPGSPNCIPATFDTSSNGHNGDITAPITSTGVQFYYAGGAMTPVATGAAAGKICLADSRKFSGLFADEVANCQAGGTPFLNPVLAVLIIRDSGVLTEGTVPVFQISTKDGDFLINMVSNGPNTLSKFPIRINVASTTPPANPTGQHNCPKGQAVPAYVGPGTPNYTPNESLCLPAGAGQAVEPSMIVDSQGTIYVESIRGVPGGLDLWRWNKNADGGPNANGTLPFKYEGQPDCGAFVTRACTMSGLAPGGGDGDVAVNGPDPSTMNIPNLAVVSLAAAEVTASNSTNRADTFSPPNPTAAHVPLDDRMWIDALNDPNHVYMEYHDFVTTSQILVQRSADKGITYDDATGIVVGPTTDTTTYASVGPPTGNIAGQIKVDLSNTPSHGNLYQIFVGPDNPTDNANNSANFINAVYVGVASSPSLMANAVLSFINHKIFSCGPGSTCPSGLGLGNLFPALAVDHFGNVYAVWSDNTDIYYSYSTDHGTSWSAAIKVTQVATIAETGHSQAGKSNVFPWVAADANGHVAIAWYGADGCCNSNTLPMSTKWNVFVAETVNGHGSAAGAPVFTLSQATDHPNHMGSISTGGLTGSSDRSLADFFQIAIDPTNHLINLAFADNHAGASVTYFTRQRQATGGIVGGQCTGHVADGQGDIRGKKGGDAHFRLHHDDCNEQPDDEEFSDPGSGTDFHATQVSSATFDDVAHSVTIVGQGVDNGLSVAFTIVAVDSSLVPPGVFSITLSDGYTNTGNLLDGSITLH
jgi:hypothetical protein